MFFAFFDYIRRNVFLYINNLVITQVLIQIRQKFDKFIASYGVIYIKSYTYIQRCFNGVVYGGTFVTRLIISLFWVLTIWTTNCITMYLFLTYFFFVRIYCKVLTTPILKMTEEDLVFHSYTHHPQTSIQILRESFRSHLQHSILLSDHVRWESSQLPNSFRLSSIQNKLFCFIFVSMFCQYNILYIFANQIHQAFFVKLH